METQVQADTQSDFNLSFPARSKTDNFSKLLYEKTLVSTEMMQFADYFKESDFKIIDRVISLAEKKKVTPAQIAIAWLLHKPQARVRVECSLTTRRLPHLSSGQAR
jgi:aryl-alcohol dehydrogenase-like predicted oxidoreductase